MSTDSNSAIPTGQHVSPIPAETLAYARQFFDFARKGDCDSIQPALEYGLPPNLTNDKGDTLVSSIISLSVRSS